MTLRSLPSVRPLALAAALATGVFLTFASTTLANSRQLSIMQDDRLFVGSGPGIQAQALADLQQLGPHTIHTVVNWRNIAPNANSTHKPSGFDGSKPQNYDPSKWDIYDSLVRGAVANGDDVQMSPAGPAPLWALKCSKKELKKYGKVKGTCKPDPKLYAAFVKAMGTRYSGTYQDENGGGALPRVKRWSIWNEPDLPSWLSPAIVKKGRTQTDVGAMVYRGLVYAALGAFKASGHAGDTILLGETAPIGGAGANATPEQFYTTLFCLDSRGHRLHGKAAKAVGCKGKLKRMNVSGVAHHPYTRGAFSSLLGRQKKGNATIAYIPRLVHILKLGARAHVISSKAASRLFWTEFGVSSSPPSSSGKGVSLATQAEWINQFQYISYRSRNVQAVVQFQLSDDSGLVTGAKTTFQTGLRFANGSHKPAWNAYQVPLYVVDQGSSLQIWGGSRVASNLAGQQIQLLNNGTPFKTISLSRAGYFLITVPKRGGTWQLSYNSPQFGTVKSRVAKPVKKSKAIASRH
jgi:hypothetical protein